MAELGPQDAYLLEKVVDPNSAEFAHLMGLLVKPVNDGKTRSQKLRGADAWKYVAPIRGDPVDEMNVREFVPFRFAERGTFRNGITSLSLALGDIIDLVDASSRKHRITNTLVVSSEADLIRDTIASAGNVSTLVYYSEPAVMQHACLKITPEVLIMDHTSLCIPIDEVLNMAYRLGIQVVDGVFPYHVAATKGWDSVAGLGKWSYTHSKNVLVVGPDDDCSRLMKYNKDDYLKFVQPSRWSGDSKKYGYEIRKCKSGLATYRAVYLGTHAEIPNNEVLEFNMPLVTNDDMVMVTINKDLAAGVFASKSNNASDLTTLEKNYAIEVRRDLFTSCVDFLISKDKGSDIVGESIRYISQHNYVDLVEGVRIVRCASLSYADALCVSMVCALTAFSLRYRLTNESLADIQRTTAASRLAKSAPFGALGRLAWLFGNFVSDPIYVAAERTRQKALSMLYNTDFIPGVCYDVVVTSSYKPSLEWFEAYNLVLEPAKEFKIDNEDPFTSFLGLADKTSAPTVLQKSIADEKNVPEEEHKYVHNIVADPVASLQHFYDEALPGNSTAQIQNAAELRRVRDVDINTEFYGKLEINKDVAVKERLLDDMPLRTSALPVSSTPLVDAIMASAKRNFNPPDIQMQSDPHAYAKYLVKKYIDHAFIPNFKETIGKTYKENPLTFNVMDYLEWRASKDASYRSALEGECPAELVELGLEKYDTMVKRRIKPKMSTAAQHELSQPQVIVSSSKKDIAMFSSVFRKVFERYDNALRPEMKCAGRSSDDDISRWLTENRDSIMSLTAVEIDSSKYDKSQGLLARMIEAELMLELGLDPGVNEIFGDSYVGKVSSRSLGIGFISSYQMKSGGCDTMLGNTVYNGVTATESVGPQNVKLMISKGDDNALWLYRAINGERAVSRMSSLFNLDAKLVVGNVLYFSSAYFIPAGEKIYFVPDLLKLTDLLGEMNFDEKLVAERFIAFQDRIRSITKHHDIPRLLQSAMRVRLGVPDLDVISAVDSAATIASSLKMYKALVQPNS